MMSAYLFYFVNKAFITHILLRSLAFELGIDIAVIAAGIEDGDRFLILDAL